MTVPPLPAFSRIALQWALPPALRSEPTWIYWHARAILAQKPTEVARAQAMASLQSIAGIRGFYEQLALEELGQRSTLPPKPLGPTPEERDIARKNAGLQRALYAIALGLRSDGVREWNYSISLHTKGGMDDRSLLAAAASLPLCQCHGFKLISKLTASKLQ